MYILLYVENTLISAIRTFLLLLQVLNTMGHDTRQEAIISEVNFVQARDIVA